VSPSEHDPLSFLSARTPRYSFDVATRSTADLDLFLSRHPIMDAHKIMSLKQVIGIGGDQADGRVVLPGLVLRDRFLVSQQSRSSSRRH
jgi:hypothetical protein